MMIAVTMVFDITLASPWINTLMSSLDLENLTGYIGNVAH
jgi:hypothetical protein